jgi:nucleoside phosphorylase
MEPVPLAFLAKGKVLGLEGELEARHPMPAEELPEGLEVFEAGRGFCTGGFVTVFEPRTEDMLGAKKEGALVEEMEGYAVARAGLAFGKGLASLRAISNRAGNRDVETWDWTGAFATLREVIKALEGLG